MVINLLFSRLLNKAILMALWTKAGLCGKSSLLEQSLSRTPSRPKTSVISVAKNLFNRRNPMNWSLSAVALAKADAFLWLKNPPAPAILRQGSNQRNPRLMNYLRAYKAPFSPPYSLLLTPYSLFLRAFGPFTSVEKPLQIFSLIMQNEPNFRKSQMNVNKVLTKDYEKMDTWWSGKNEPKTNPIKAN